jgi:hypothetical protein
MDSAEPLDCADAGQTKKVSRCQVRAATLWSCIAVLATPEE